MLSRTTLIASTFSLYFPHKPLRRSFPIAAPTLRRLLSLPSLRLLPRFSTLSPLCSTSAAAKTVEPCYLSCSLPEKKPLKVAVLLSGGLDSSLALRLLHAAGHSCTAFYLKIWFQEDFENFWSECPWEEDLRYAKAVCDQVDVPLEVVHLTDEYWNNVVSYIIDEYRYGRTPNPDVLCNTRIKFGAFMDAISGMSFDYIASGHYAKVVHPNSDNKDEPSALRLSKDMVKDQTYFLSHLSQSQLKRLIFPLGCIEKEEVRRLAKIFGLPNQDRKDSQGICFLGKIKFSEFVARHIGEEEGLILEAETGDFLGNHRGFWFYTIGQRQGLRLPGGPWYVVEKAIENNVVFVSRNYFSVDKRRRQFRVGSLRFFSGSPPRITQLQCKQCRDENGFNLISLEKNKGLFILVHRVHLALDRCLLSMIMFNFFFSSRTYIGSEYCLAQWYDSQFDISEKAKAQIILQHYSSLSMNCKERALESIGMTNSSSLE
ncbi:hypothetical protein SASPL_155950 [Salvia splendens]|uniref:tRNA-5-taurinomethyluridine 2-sulfurtransferase n=1 Tax=Salvia splendens TaxID=180675 RepID=A0A8X8VXQ1_SALSN|nr:hypothetical protein SASPL_155950 [Salvia splendens]